jgi:hypothetical protein
MEERRKEKMLTPKFIGGALRGLKEMLDCKT